jgi:hypothetical protein
MSDYVAGEVFLQHWWGIVEEHDKTHNEGHSSK